MTQQSYSMRILRYKITRRIKRAKRERRAKNVKSNVIKRTRLTRTRTNNRRFRVKHRPNKFKKKTMISNNIVNKRKQYLTRRSFRPINIRKLNRSIETPKKRSGCGCGS